MSLNERETWTDCPSESAILHLLVETRVALIKESLAGQAPASPGLSEGSHMSSRV